MSSVKLLTESKSIIQDNKYFMITCDFLFIFSRSLPHSTEIYSHNHFGTLYQRDIKSIRTVFCSHFSYKLPVE